MKTTLFFRVSSALACAAFAFATTSCMTTYDSAGRPMQTVDPALATAGVVAAGVLGYALSQNNHNHGYYRGYGGGYYRPCYY